MDHANAWSTHTHTLPCHWVWKTDVQHSLLRLKELYLQLSLPDPENTATVRFILAFVPSPVTLQVPSSLPGSVHQRWLNTGMTLYGALLLPSLDLLQMWRDTILNGQNSPEIQPLLEKGVTQTMQASSALSSQSIPLHSSGANSPPHFPVLLTLLCPGLLVYYYYQVVRYFSYTFVHFHILIVHP